MKSSMIVRLMCGLCIVLFMLQCFSAWAENASLQQSNVAIKSAEVEAKVQRPPKNCVAWFAIIRRSLIPMPSWHRVYARKFVQWQVKARMTKP